MVLETLMTLVGRHFVDSADSKMEEFYNTFPIPGKGPDECPSGCIWRGRKLFVEKGEAVGQGGDTSMMLTP